ncbi:HalOD1 output domain-containing protein [Natrarchaeobaculum aegyptiacum]|uniref:HalOD1 output domain-containing protein n=1 Tax=Natrarchaeobaculum aegyptiacum TaxID=745377 RepID=UPI00126026B2|nr:HalOD1 output domain-containing protein [Natrarchaeobaculum aegyptiacum]
MNSDSNASSDIFEHDPASNTYYTTLEWTTHDPSVAVVELIARLLDADPTDLEPLAWSIDPSALDAILQGQQEGPSTTPCTVDFSYLGHRITVSSDGRVEVEPPDDVEVGNRPTNSSETNSADLDREEPAASEESTVTDENGDEDLPRPD